MDLLQKIRAAADHDVEILTSQLRSIHGVARMGLAQTLGSAKSRSNIINLIIAEGFKQWE